MRTSTLALLALAACGRGEITLDPLAPDTPGNPDILVAGVQISPERAFTDTDLSVTATAQADNPDTLQWRYVWYVDGQAVQDGESATLAASQHRRDQEVFVRAVATDGEWPSAPGQSPTITILNTPPTLAGASLAPAEVRATDVLTCTAREPFDLDGDPVTPRFSWWIDGERVALDSATFGPNAFRRDQDVACSIVPFDGTDIGDQVQSQSITVLNSPPRIQSVRVAPSPAFTNSTLTGEVVASDPDGDAVSYGWQWRVNDQEAGTSAALTGSAFRRGDTVTVTVSATDGLDRAEPLTSAAITIQNSPPTAPEVVIDPEDPRKGQSLVCEIATPSVDADDDRLTYVVDWYLDGAKYDGTTRSTLHSGDTLPGAATEVGQSWTCRAQAWDRIDTSPWSADSEAVVIDEGVWVLDIPVAQLINQGVQCWASNIRYSCSGGGYGFWWDDPADIMPESVEVEYNHGFNCSTTGTRTASLNGATVGSASTGDSGNCTCATSAPTWVKGMRFTPPGRYDPGSRNDWTMSRFGCEGFTALPDWARDDGTPIYARVTLRY